MSNILIFDMKIENAKDSDFCVWWCQGWTFLMCGEAEWQKIYDFPDAKDNDNQCWKLVGVKDHYLIRFFLGRMNIFNIPISSM